MAYRTAEEQSWFPRPALILAGSELHPASHRPVGLPAPAASLAVLLLCVTFLAAISGAFWAGRMVEQRTQLGYLLAAAPALEQMQAATRSADSLGMMLMIQAGRVKRGRGGR